MTGRALAVFLIMVFGAAASWGLVFWAAGRLGQ